MSRQNVVLTWLAMVALSLAMWVGIIISICYISVYVAQKLQ